MFLNQITRNLSIPTPGQGALLQNRPTIFRKWTKIWFDGPFLERISYSTSLVLANQKACYPRSCVKAGLLIIAPQRSLDMRRRMIVRTKIQYMQNTIQSRYHSYASNAASGIVSKDQSTQYELGE